MTMQSQAEPRLRLCDLAPSHWTIAPLRARYDVTLGKMLDAKRISGEMLAPYLRNVNVQWDYVTTDDLPQMDFTDDERRRLSLRYGDLLVCEGGDVGRTAMWRGELPDCYFQKAIHRVRPLSNQDHSRFLLYVMWAAATAGEFRAGSNPNTIDHLTEEQLRNYRMPFPSKQEQELIAQFLDVETAKLDTLIDKKGQHVAALFERRRAVGAWTLLRGLDPSQIEAELPPWATDVPTSWSRVRLGSMLLDVTNGAWGSDPTGDGHDIPCVRAADFDRVKCRVNTDGLALRSLTRGELQRYLLVEGDLLLEKSGGGDLQPVGKVVAYDGALPAVYSNFLARMRPVRGYDSSFLSLLFDVLYQVGLNKRAIKQTTGIQNLDQRAYLSLTVAVPPLAVQLELVAAVKREHESIDELIALVGDSRRLLSEYRSALIAAAVTGRIDVRNGVV
jgi:type I restriction enzyme S subunit